ncbi:MAG: RES family NAD+ phosphorylase [Pseudomonadota bacterium]
MAEFATAYRIADPEFSNTPEEMLSGYGAQLYGGRWNSEGVPCAYLGDSRAVAAMEILVHHEEAPILDLYSIMQVDIPLECVLSIEPDSLPEGWDATDRLDPASQRVGDQWLASSASLALVVPSVASPGDFAMLVNPRHPDFDKLTCGPIEPYRLDARLLAALRGES